MTRLRGVTRSARARILLAIVLVASPGLLVVGGSTDLVLRDRLLTEIDEARRRVFERFARTGGGRGVSGTGLRLSIALAIAETHGGSARLEDGADGGTRALIEVPTEGAVHATHPRR